MSSLPPHDERRIASWSFGRVLEAIDGRWVEGGGGADRGLRGISTDTRRLEPGEVFVALRGENFDGHDFLEEAVEAGACGAIVEAGFEPSGSVLSEVAVAQVESTRRALADLGHAVWREATDEGLHTVDVTGSNGKTTTKELLRAVWSTRGEVFATPGNLNNAIGLPLTLCALPTRAEHAIFEMGANAPGEISELIEMAPGDERLITSIGVAHTEGFGSVDGIRRAKSEIFERAGSDTRAVVPEGERDRLVLEEFPGEILTFGREAGADLRLVDYRPVGDDSRSRQAVYEGPALGGSGGQCTIRLDLPGSHNGLNLAAALLTLRARGLATEPAELSEALAVIELPGGRWRRWRGGDLAVVDDAYNANPSSVRASFAAFLEATPPEDLADETPRRAAILGEMHELGEEAERWHREVAAELADTPGLDALCAVGEFAEAMKEAARERREELVVAACAEAEEAAEWLFEQRPAFAWMKASRANGLERVIERLERMRDDG